MVAVCPPITSMVPGVFLQQKHTHTYSFRVYMHFYVFYPDAYITHLRGGQGDMTIYTMDDIFVH